MDISRLMSRLAAIGGMQGSVTEAEEAKKPDADKDGIPDWADKDEEKVDEAKKPDADKDDKEKVDENSLDSLRKLAGITECGDEYEMDGQMSPMSVTGTEEPSMGVPAQVMSMDTEVGPSADANPKAKYTLSIQNGENNLSMTTDMPDEIIHIMKLAGVNKGAEVTKTEAPESDEEEQNEGPKKEVEEEWGNTPAQTNAREPKAFGDIRDWGQKGTGKGQADSASRKPFGQGDNPLGEQAMMEAYKKFKASK